MLLIAGGTIAFVACSSDDDNSSNNNGSNTQQDAGGNPETDSGNPSETTDSGGQEATADSIGTVMITGSTTKATETGMTNASITFYADPVAGPSTGNLPLGCKTDEAPDGTGNTGPLPAQVSAGDITINIGDNSGTLSWDDASNSYSRSLDAENNWITGGDDVSVVAAAGGDTVPAFTANLNAPHMPTFTSDLTTMAQGADYTLTWDNGAASEQIQVMLLNTSGGTTTTVSCVFNSIDGSGIIPKAQLTDLGAGDAVTFIATSTTATRAPAGDNKVDVSVKTTYNDTAAIAPLPQE